MESSARCDGRLNFAEGSSSVGDGGEGGACFLFLTRRRRVEGSVEGVVDEVVDEVVDGVMEACDTPHRMVTPVCAKRCKLGDAMGHAKWRKIAEISRFYCAVQSNKLCKICVISGGGFDG